MKTRTIVWTIVGILVVLAIIFTIVTRRGSAVLEGKRKMTEEDYRQYRDRELKRIEKFEARFARKLKSLPSPSPEEQAKIDEVNAKIAELKSYLAEYDNLTTDEQRKEWYQKCQEARKGYKDAYHELFQMKEEGED